MTELGRDEGEKVKIPPLTPILRLPAAGRSGIGRNDNVKKTALIGKLRTRESKGSHPIRHPHEFRVIRHPDRRDV